MTSLAIFLMNGCIQTDKTNGINRPNVILILADDMAYGDLSGINGGLSQTPSLDRLAQESVWFSQGYSAAPVCAHLKERDNVRECPLNNQNNEELYRKRKEKRDDHHWF
ncbi:hypothetical protein ES708_19095 [subsurface metagenome]